MPESDNRPANLPSAAETEDLLARLARARAELDTPAEAPGGDVPLRFGIDRRKLLVPGALLLVAVLVAVAVLLGRGSGGPEAVPPPAAVPSTTAPASATPTPTPTPTPSATPGPAGTPRPALDWPGSTTGLPAGLPATGPGVTEPGEEVTVAPSTGLTLEVYERVLLRAPGVAAAVLAAQDLTAVPSLPLGKPVWVRDLEVTADGRPARAVWSGGRWTVRSAVPGQTYRSFTVRYRVANGVLPQGPAASGRASLLVTPLWAAEARRAGLPVLARADARIKVRDAACPDAAPRGDKCGRRVGGVLIGVLPADSGAAVVLLRAVLPAAALR